MIFTRTHRFQSTVSVEQMKKRLLGQHVKIHNLDFEVFEKERTLRIIPHAENVENVKTLPITHVDFKGEGATTQVIVTSKMRRIDKGGPLLLIWFSFFMLLAGVILNALGGIEYQLSSFVLMGVAILVFAILWFRLESGYFDYVRKIRNFIKNVGTSAA